MEIWMVSREYAGLAESGGVKNVVCSLSEKLSEQNHSVTLFMPFYGCTDISRLESFSLDRFTSCRFMLCGKETKVTYSTGICKGVKVVLIGHQAYQEKHNVYTYCDSDLKAHPEAKTGTGYADDLYLNALLAYGILNWPEASGLQNAPHIVHCHDACPAVVPSILKYKSQFFAETRYAVTIHNAGPAYHHEYSDFNQAKWYTDLPDEVLSKAMNGNRVEPYLLAADCSFMTTVSEAYAEEILSPDNPNTDGLSQGFVQKASQIYGITNGIDSTNYTPENTAVSLMPYPFSPSSGDFEGKLQCRRYLMEKVASEASPEYGCLKRSGYLDEKGKVYFSYHGRLVRQKGIFILLDASRMLLQKNPDVRFIINGQGEEVLQDLCSKLAEEFPGRFVYFKGYDKKFSRLCTVSGDFAVLPSEFEPCGLEDFIAQLFGTIPVAHATGGLKKIKDGKTGFLYSPNTPETLSAVMEKLAAEKMNDPDKFRQIAMNASRYVKEKYSWENVCLEEYIPLYEKMISKKK